jgi:ferredoxin, 2Fe-2S
MPRLTIITRTGAEADIVAQNGQSLMEALHNAGFDDLLAICGGSCSCGTCHVYIDPEFAAHLPPMHDDEDDVLEGSYHRKAASRLSCQIPVTDSLDGMHLTIAPQE